MQAGCKGIADLILAMYHEDPLRLCTKTLNPANQAFLICMTTDTGQNFNVRLNFHRLAKKLHFVRALHQRTTQCADCLIAHEQNCAFRSPQIVLQMMTDTPRLAHTGRGENHLRLIVKIDHFRLVTGNRKA